MLFQKKKYKGYNKKYELTTFKTIRSFGDAADNGIITIYIANDKHNYFVSNTKLKKLNVENRKGEH